MTSWWDEAPTPQELAVWSQVASVPSASGTFRWESHGEFGFGWFFSGPPPALVDVPAGEDVAFWHVPPDRWRLEVRGELRAVSDGTRAAAWVPDGVRVGPTLLMPSGPAALLLPGHGGARPTAEDGHTDEVARDDLLGRRVWRWRSGTSAWWLDEETGCGLRHEQAGGAMSFTELQLDVDIDPARFTVPDIARDGVVEWCHVEPPDQVPRLSPSAPEFTVAWWPTGALSHPDRGDPTVPSCCSSSPLSSTPRGSSSVSRRPADAPGPSPAARCAGGAPRSGTSRCPGGGTSYPPTSTASSPPSRSSGDRPELAAPGGLAGEPEGGDRPRTVAGPRSRRPRARRDLRLPSA